MVVVIDPEWWASGVWAGHPIRQYVQRRDVAVVFRFLHARGLSYGAIAAAVGLSPNRAAEIARGTRQVTAYDVLERIAVGLQIPRAAMGLGVDHDPGIGLPERLDDRGPVGRPSTERTGSGAWTARASNALADLRVDLNEALASGSVSPRQLELIEESAAEHASLYPATPPTVMLSRLANECAEVRTLSRRRQPASVQSRLSATAALLTTMCADALMRLGDVHEARSWCRTAIHAADDSGEPRLRVLVRAQATMLPYYFGDPRQSVSTADAALAIECSPTPSTALAAAAKARALARIGAAGAARDSIKLARRLFDEAGDPDSDAAFRFPAKRLLLYLSGALTWLGDTAAACQAQDEALRLYGQVPAAPIDPALINLDRAMCLARDRRAQEAAVTAREAITNLPSPQRTEIILTMADGVAAIVPAIERRGEVTALTECVRNWRECAGSLASGTSALDV